MYSTVTILGNYTDYHLCAWKCSKCYGNFLSIRHLSVTHNDQWYNGNSTV